MADVLTIFGQNHCFSGKYFFPNLYSFHCLLLSLIKINVYSPVHVRFVSTPLARVSTVPIITSFIRTCKLSEFKVWDIFVNNL